MKHIIKTILTTLILAFALFAVGSVSAAELMKFQGKVTEVDGSELADGVYDFSFRLYDAPTGGALVWSEDLIAGNLFSGTVSGVVVAADSVTYTYGGSSASSTVRVGQYLTNAGNSEETLIIDFGTSTITVASGSPVWNIGDNINNRVFVEGGVIEVDLGSVTDITGVDFSGDMFLEVEFNTEIMQPRKAMIGVTNAFNADRLDGMMASDFANLLDNQVADGEWQFNNIVGIATSSTGAALTVNQIGTGTIAQFQVAGVDALSILNDGRMEVGTGATSYRFPADRAGSSVGYILKLDGAGNLTWDADLVGSGGSWATSTGDAFIYPADTAQAVVIGHNATSSTGYMLEVNGDSYFDNVAISDGQNLIFYDSSGSNFINLRASSTVATNYTITLPTAPGVAGQAMLTDSNGNLYWSDPVGVNVLDDLNNVDLTGAATSSLMVYDGANWVDISVLATTSLDSLVMVQGENISLLNNNAGYITSADDIVSGAELDGVFGSNGILLRTGAGTYSVIVNNSANWDSAYSQVNASSSEWSQAYGWGDHSALYIPVGHEANNITVGSTTNWDSAYGQVNASSSEWTTAYNWGNHAGQNYFDTDTDVLSVGLGGTGVTSWTAGELVYASSSSELVGVDTTGVGNGWALTYQGGVPTWASTSPGTTHELLSIMHSDTNSATIAARGDMLIRTAAGEWDAINTGLAGEILYSDGTDPSWSSFANLFDARLSATTSLPNITNLENLSVLGTISTGVWNASIIPVAYGGTGQANLNDLIEMGTSTTGTYVDSLSSGGSITITGAAGEAWVPVIDIAANAITPTELNIGSNGSNGQVLVTNGDGSFSWADASSTGVTLTNEEVEDIAGAMIATTSLITVAYDDYGDLVAGKITYFVNPDLSLYNNATSSFITMTNLSFSGTGMSYDNGTGVFSLDAGYNISLDASSTNWNWAYNYVQASSTNWDTAYNTTLGLGTMATESNTGSTTITILGTIATGTWEGDVVGVAFGGTGRNDQQDGYLLIGNNSGGYDLVASTSLGSVPDFDGLTNVSVGGAAIGDLVKYTATGWVNIATSTLGINLTDTTGLISINSRTTDTLDVNRGGTGVTSWTAGGLIFASSSDELAQIATGTNGYALTWDNTLGHPVWSATVAGTSHDLLDGNVNQDTEAVSPTRGDLIVANAASNWTALNRGNQYQLLTLDGNGDVIWATSTFITELGTVDAGIWNGDLVANTYGGTGWNSSAETGFAYLNNGIWSASTTISSVNLDSLVMLQGEDISLLTNNSGFITDANDSVSGAELDGVFGSNGILVRTGVGTYAVISDSSTNWNSSYSQLSASSSEWGDAYTWSNSLYNSIGLSALSQGEVDQLEQIGAVTITSAQWGYLGTLDQNLRTIDSPTFAGISINGNMIISGTVDGVDLSAASTTWDSQISNLESSKQDVNIGTANRVLISNGSGVIAVSGTISDTELGYLDNIASNVQAQLNAKYDSLTDMSLATGNIYIGDGSGNPIATSSLPVASGGTGKNSWTPLSIPYMQGTTTMSEITIGTSTYVLAVNADADGYEWVSASSTGVDTVRSDEEIMDLAAAIASTTNNLLAINDNDANDTLEFTVNNNLSNYDWTNIGISHLTVARGGTGWDSSVETGFAYLDNGTWSASSTISSGSLDSSVMLQGENISLLTNNLGFISDANDSVDGTELDGVFGTNGILTRTGAGTYAVITNSSANWDSAYAQVNASSSEWTTAFNWGNHASQNYFDTDTDTLSVALGGTGETSWTAGELVYASSSDDLEGVDTVGVGNGWALTYQNGVPTWASTSPGATHDLLSAMHGDTNDLATPARGDMLVRTAAGEWDTVNIGLAGEMFYSDGSDPAWISFANLFDARLSATTSLPNITSLANLDTVGVIVNGTWQADIIDIAHGGTGASTTVGAVENLGLTEVKEFGINATGTAGWVWQSDGDGRGLWVATSTLGIGVAGSVPKFIGTTTATFDGHIATSSLEGYMAANNICDYEYPGSSFCRTYDILATIAEDDISGWGAGTQTAWIAEGPPGYISNSNDCNGWTTNANDFLGAFWKFNANTGGSGVLTACPGIKPLACCKK